MNVNKICTQCKLIVYPLEQLKCLDQIWHKKCFRCQTCGMILTMGNYRGYEKKPYCSAHYPQPKRFTLVADTPELQRVAQNTRILSNAAYSRRFSQTSAPNQQNQSQPIGGYVPTHHITAKSNGHNSNSSNINRWSNSDSTPVSYQSEKSGNSHAFHNEHQSNGQRTHDTETYRSMTNEDLTGPSVTPYELITSSNSQFGSHPSRYNYRLSSEPDEAITTMDSTTNVPGVQKFRAMYDYVAMEDDEVTFIEGDIILDGDPITDGWMYGTVQRTGEFGMLPSNYVEPI